MAVGGAAVLGATVVGSTVVGIVVGTTSVLSPVDETASATTIKNTMPTVHTAESTRPAMAMPRPFCPGRLVWLSAMNPKMNPSRTTPMMPKISAAVAKRFAPRLRGGQPGGGPYPTPGDGEYPLPGGGV